MEVMKVQQVFPGKEILQDLCTAALTRPVPSLPSSLSKANQISKRKSNSAVSTFSQTYTLPDAAFQYQAVK